MQIASQPPTFLLAHTDETIAALAQQRGRTGTLHERADVRRHLHDRCPIALAEPVLARSGLHRQAADRSAEVQQIERFQLRSRGSLVPHSATGSSPSVVSTATHGRRSPTATSATTASTISSGVVLRDDTACHRVDHAIGPVAIAVQEADDGAADALPERQCEEGDGDRSDGSERTAEEAITDRHDRRRMHRRAADRSAATWRAPARTSVSMPNMRSRRITHTSVANCSTVIHWPTPIARLGAPDEQRRPQPAQHHHEDRAHRAALVADRIHAISCNSNTSTGRKRRDEEREGQRLGQVETRAERELGACQRVVGEVESGDHRDEDPGDRRAPSSATPPLDATDRRAAGRPVRVSSIQFIAGTSSGRTHESSHTERSPNGRSRPTTNTCSAHPWESRPTAWPRAANACTTPTNRSPVDARAPARRR